MSDLATQIQQLRTSLHADSAARFSLDALLRQLSGKEFGLQETQHTIEVVNLALSLAGAESLTAKARSVVLIAAILHDLGRYLDDTSGRHHTQVQDSHVASYIDKTVAAELRHRILLAIQRHSMGSKEKPENLEEKIVFDADNLTIFTEFGVKRWFFKAEAWGHVQNVQDADSRLLELFTKATAGDFLYLSSSRAMARQSYFQKMVDIGA